MKTNSKFVKVLTGEVRLSYTHVFKPQSVNGGAEKYNTAILIPKTDKETIQEIKEATEKAKELGKSNKWGGKIPHKCKTPLHDGDEDYPDDPAYAGHYYLNASSNSRPDVIKLVGRGADGKYKFEKVTDTTEVYSGCYARVSLNIYPFDVNGSRGVAAGLNGVAKVKEGEPLSGRSSAANDFADVDFGIDMDVDEDELF